MIAQPQRRKSRMACQHPSALYSLESPLFVTFMCLGSWEKTCFLRRPFAILDCSSLGQFAIIRPSGLNLQGQPEFKPAVWFPIMS